jgi:hypothetical protein
VTRTRRTYSPEYKTESALLVINTGRTIADVARELGIREQMLGRWVKAERIAVGLGPAVVEPDFAAPPPAAVERTPYDGPSLLTEVRQAIEHMETLPQDQGLIALAERYAHHVDQALEAGGKEANKVMFNGYLFSILKELGGSPMMRKNLASTKDAKKKGSLSHLRAVRGGSGGGETG